MERIIIRETAGGVAILVQFPHEEFIACSFGGALNLLDYLQAAGWIDDREWNIAYNALERAA